MIEQNITRSNKIIAYKGKHYIVVNELEQQGNDWNYIVSRHCDIDGIVRYKPLEHYVKPSISEGASINSMQLIYVPVDICEKVSSIGLEGIQEKYKPLFRKYTKGRGPSEDKIETKEDGKKASKYKCKNNLPVIKCIETGKEYYTGDEAAADTGVKAIYAICNHKYKKETPYHFEWIIENKFPRVNSIVK